MGGVPTGGITPDEILWRLIENSWYHNGMIQEVAFVGEVSLVRASLVTEKEIDSVKNGFFVKYGIAQLKCADIINQQICQLRITPDPNWPLSAHVLIIRNSGGKHLNPKHLEVAQLANLANARPLVRHPKA